MTDLYSVATGDTVEAADVNQYKTALEGGDVQQYALLQKSGANFIVRLATNDGTDKVSIQDSGSNEVASINSDGDIVGIMEPTTFTFPSASSPSQTAEGQAIWDSDDDILVVGTGSGRVRIGAIQLIGSDTAEYTTTSTSATDLVTVTLTRDGSAEEEILIRGAYRKSSGSASEADLGLKINSTTVIEASAATTALARTSASNQAEDGFFEIILGPRVTSYQSGILSLYSTKVSSTGAAAQAQAACTGLTALMPTDDITSITIRGISGNANVTLAVKFIEVFAYQKSSV